MRSRWIGSLTIALIVTSACRSADPRTPRITVQDDALTQVHQQLAAREYRASENDRGLQAPNRAHDLRTYFEPTGIRIHDRTAQGSPELLRVSLAGIGRGAEIARASAGVVSVTQDGRVEIRRPGIVEWYVNSTAGLEQGFTLERPASGDGPLFVELAVAGTRLVPRGDAIVFETHSGRRLGYGQLAVVDATHRAVPSHFELADPQRLRIAVDDANATYPLVIDPLFTEIPDTHLESEQEAGFGVSVAGAGDVNSDGYADIIVGATGYDTGASGQGAAFVFHGSASGIADGGPLTATTQIPCDSQCSSFGRVAGAGDVNGDGYDDVIVGDSDYASAGLSGGGAFVFLGSASGISSGTPATAATRLLSDENAVRFGGSVAGAGDVNGDGYDDVIVGARDYTFTVNRQGAAFVYLGSASGIAHGGPSTAASNFRGDQTLWQYGRSVAGAGDVNGDGYDDIIVGAPSLGNGQDGEGAAYVYLGSASGIPNGSTTNAPTRFESNDVGGSLGFSVAGAGDVNSDGYGDVIVGAYGVDSGAAYLFHGSATGIAYGNPTTAATRLWTTQTVVFPNPAPLFGQSVAGAGDVNGDGYSDVVVAATFYSAGEQWEGAAFVFLGSPSGVPDGTAEAAPAQLESNVADARLGSVAGVGDVNGDGADDVIAGASDYGSSLYDERRGAAFLYLPEPGAVLPLACGFALALALARRRGVC